MKINMLVIGLTVLCLSAFSSPPLRGTLEKKSSPQPSLQISVSLDTNLLTGAPHEDIIFKWTATATYVFQETFTDGEVVNLGPVTRDGGQSFSIGVDIIDGVSQCSVQAIPQ